MTTPPTVYLNPYEAAALTRLVMSYCLGKGSICVYSRSYVLQLPQPKRYGDYSRYQWRRLCQFIPTAKEPKFVPMKSNDSLGQWRLRISSRWFETAYNLLYPLEHAEADGYRLFRLNRDVLGMLGAEAIASIWADRARLIASGSGHRAQLNLSRLDFEQAELIADWIAALTGAHSRLGESARNPGAPMLFYSPQDLARLLVALRPTWMAQANCLERKFQLPGGSSTEELLLAAEPIPIAPGGDHRPLPRHGARRRGARRQLPMSTLPPDLKRTSA